MELSNNTPLPAAIVPNAEGDETITALFIACATYRIAGGRLELARAQRPLILLDEEPIPHDAHFQKTVSSVCATGFVYAPGGEATRAEARLAVGEIERSAVAFGPRVWEDGIGPGGLSPSSPAPFERAAMTWQNAFGGKALVKTQVMKIDGEETIVPEHLQAFAWNSDGTGFHVDAARARGEPLPQIENPDALLRAWNDRPEPVCFAPYPLYGGLRAATVIDDGKVNLSLVGRLYSRAAPRTTFKELPPGTAIRLSGMRPGGEVLSFHVPPPPVTVTVDIGGRASTLDLRVDAVDIDAEAAEARVVYRAILRYAIIQFEARRTRVETNEAFRSSLPKG